MTNIQTFKIKMIGSRTYTIQLETYGMNEWQIDKALDAISDDISKGRDVENCIHYF